MQFWNAPALDTDVIDNGTAVEVHADGVPYVVAVGTATHYGITRKHVTPEGHVENILVLELVMQNSGVTEGIEKTLVAHGGKLPAPTPVPAKHLS